MNTDLIMQALLLPLFWLLIFCLTLFIGFAILPFNKYKGVLYGNIFNRFWLGLGGIIAFLQIWNLWLPVNIYTWLFLLPVAIIGFIKFRRADVKFNFGDIPRIPLGLLIIVGVFMVISSLDNSYIYDTRVYHFYTIKWFNNYRVTPGMANLYIYLGNNQSYFLFPAFLNALWGKCQGACATNGLLGLVLCADIIIANARALTGKQQLSFHSVFQLLFLPLCINIGVQNLSSPTPDAFVNLLTVKIFSDLIACLAEKKFTFQDIFQLAFYCVFGVVMKLSFAGVALGVMVVVLWMLFSNKLWKGAPIIASIGMFFFLVIPFLIRGAISSGYIMFPSTAFPLDVDWRLPKLQLEELNSFIKGFARTAIHGPAANAAAYDTHYRWLPDWWHRVSRTFTFIIPVGVFIVTPIFFAIQKINTAKLYQILFPVFIALTFWFVMAPDIRFAVFLLWSLGLASLAYALLYLPEGLHRCFPIFVIICSLCIMARNWNRDITPLGDLPVRNGGVFTTRSGFKLNMIDREDIWDISDCDIPCSPQPDSNLMLRGIRIDEGFKKIEHK